MMSAVIEAEEKERERQDERNGGVKMKRRTKETRWYTYERYGEHRKRMNRKCQPLSPSEIFVGWNFVLRLNGTLDHERP